MNALPFNSPFEVQCQRKTCVRSICLSGGIKAKGPISTSLSRDRPLFIRPLNALVVTIHAVCHLAKRSYCKELAGDEGSMARVYRSNGVCLFRYSKVKRQNHLYMLVDAEANTSIHLKAQT